MYTSCIYSLCIMHYVHLIYKVFNFFLCWFLVVFDSFTFFFLLIGVILQPPLHNAREACKKFQINKQINLKNKCLLTKKTKLLGFAFTIMSKLTLKSYLPLHSRLLLPSLHDGFFFISFCTCMPVCLWCPWMASTVSLSKYTMSWFHHQQQRSCTINKLLQLL